MEAEARRNRRRRTALAAVAASIGGCALAAACLPDLATFPVGPDASGVTKQISTCGDGVIDLPEEGRDGGESCDPGEAGAAGCENCRFTCSGVVDDAGHCYFFADPTTTYNQATVACKGAAAHVVSFASAREAAFVGALVSDAGSYWVGLAYDDVLGGYASPAGVNEPGWPDKGASCAGCFAVGSDDAGAFALATGADAGARNSCIVAERGIWLRADCNEGATPRTTLCEREPIGQRIYPCGGLLCTTLTPTEATKRYVVWPTTTSAEQARSLCESSYDGGRLALLDTPEEREQLARELRERLVLPARVWIGLSRRDGGWVWDDDKSVEQRPLPWGEGQPSQVSSSGRAFLRIDDSLWDTQLAGSDDDADAGGYVFVCERPF